MAYGLLAIVWLRGVDEDPVYVGEHRCCRTNFNGENEALIVEEANDIYGEEGWDYMEFLTTMDSELQIENPKKK